MLTSSLRLKNWVRSVTDAGLLITFASQQHKLIPPRINIVHHDLHVLVVLTSCLRQYILKY